MPALSAGLVRRRSHNRSRHRAILGCVTSKKSRFHERCQTGRGRYPFTMHGDRTNGSAADYRSVAARFRSPAASLKVKPNSMIRSLQRFERNWDFRGPWIA